MSYIGPQWHVHANVCTRGLGVYVSMIVCDYCFTPWCARLVFASKIASERVTMRFPSNAAIERAPSNNYGESSNLSHQIIFGCVHFHKTRKSAVSNNFSVKFRAHTTGYVPDIICMRLHEINIV